MFVLTSVFALVKNAVPAIPGNSDFRFKISMSNKPCWRIFVFWLNPSLCVYVTLFSLCYKAMDKQTATPSTIALLRTVMAS